MNLKKQFITIFCILCSTILVAQDLDRKVISKQIGGGLISVDYPKLDTESLDIWVDNDDSLRPIIITLTKDYQLSNGLSLSQGTYYIFATLQSDSTVLLYFDKAGEVQKYSGKPSAMLQLEPSETIAENLELTLSFDDESNLVIQGKSMEVSIKFNEVASSKGSWCCSNHENSHCGEASELAGLSTRYGCKDFVSN